MSDREEKDIEVQEWDIVNRFLFFAQSFYLPLISRVPAFNFYLLATAVQSTGRKGGRKNQLSSSHCLFSFKGSEKRGGQGQFIAIYFPA